MNKALIAWWFAALLTGAHGAEWKWYGPYKSQAACKTALSKSKQQIEARRLRGDEIVGWQPYSNAEHLRAGLCTWNSFCKAAPDGTFIKITEDCGQSETLK